MDYLADHSDIVTLSDVVLCADPGRAIVRPFAPSDPEEYADPLRSRPQRILDRVLALGDDEVGAILDRMISIAEDRPRDFKAYLLRHFEKIDGELISPGPVSEERKLLIAAYFCAEYSFEAAALFNPSIIPHPEKPDLPGSGLRFLMSLRSVGEGHVSSVTFRSGSWSQAAGFKIDPAQEHGIMLQVARTEGQGNHMITSLAREQAADLSEIVLFPMTESQRQGIEDMRLVLFAEPNSEPVIYGTYTAFDGRSARPEMMRVDLNPRAVALQALRGSYSTGKGMALFPRKVGGRFMMLSRQDQENIWLLGSDDPYEWNEGRKLLEPLYPWEYIQLGNCGSPMEIDEGWLVLTHGVGVVRSYAIGACLLDKDDPAKVIGRLAAPLVRPGPLARDGYVPNVVYSCGGLVHDRTLLLPYAVADSFTRFASVRIDALLSRMETAAVATRAPIPEMASS